MFSKASNYRGLRHNSKKLFGIFIVYFRKSIIQDNIFLEIGFIAIFIAFGLMNCYFDH